MERIPFGIKQLDTIVDGGAPPGSVVLLSGEAGAAAREFMYTSAIMNALPEGDSELYDLYYGQLPANARHPDAVHYVSFTNGQAQFHRELTQVVETDIVDAAFDHITFHDLSTAYFQVSPVPRDWYASRAPEITDLRTRSDREGILSTLGDLLNQHAPDNLVVIDSLSDLVSAIGEELEWSHLMYLVKGLAKAAYDWNALILLHVNFETLSTERHGQLDDAATGTMRFQWETGGSERARTMVVKQFRGVLSQIEAENIVKFETEISDAGFDISDVRKIR
jgi:KaiC/GvpD/RAD55 family RecA-like ATPase